ncbi:alpha/beta hydrolase [Burkholderia vietnamiensis]|uniref:alpha/beta hydrolase n=1 Tax=Burkholderia vietnamiensis TaxID=60552 RepID=UPI001CB480C0|nr:alpha/beta hydrolase [Burkholderia vietnamiensis]CAG9197620.1 hypothetical protein BVI434_1410015 [Burkholderia vietnamiensis]
MRACSKSAWPPRLVTVPGLHGSEGAHWQSWLERQFARSLRVEQADWDAPDLVRWAQSVRALLERVGFYRLVWHRSIFDLGIYVFVLAAVVVVSHHLVAS